MKVGYVRGNKSPKDRKIWIQTTYKDNKKSNFEYFSIFKLALLINQIGINEHKIWGNCDIFEKAIKETLAHTISNIDWAEKKNRDMVRGWCSRNKLNFEEIESELERTIQKKVVDYDNK